MSGKVRQRVTANTADSATLSINEKILKECHSIYTDPENGLVKIAANLGLDLLAPRKKISVLLIGNHSAGKSSFINWYVEEHIQKTGVAIETQGFTFVTSGRKRESLSGNATLHLYPHFEPLRQHPGVVDYLQTEISTSKQKKFSLVTFVDTPGLVDGDMKYPFDVNVAIEWLGNLSDLIFVFFDPMGQALCKRTLNLVEKLNENHADKINYFLSKADEAGSESDRQRVMMQIVQELCKRPGLNRTGFDMPTIYIPNPNKPSRCNNQIEEVCKQVEKTINHTIQNTLNSLEKDCETIADLVDKKIESDGEARSYNMRATFKGIFFMNLALFFPFIAVLVLIASMVSQETLISMLGLDITEYLYIFLSPVQRIWRAFSGDNQIYFIIAICVITLCMMILAKLQSRKKPTLTRKQKRMLLDNRDYVQNFVHNKKQVLYNDYLKQSIAEIDL